MTGMLGMIAKRTGQGRFFACILALALSSGAIAEANLRDPYEGFNRSMFAVNEVVDKFAAKPVAQAYDQAVPLPVKAGIGNLFGNVSDLWVGINSALQGKFGDAGVDIGRLLVNSTIGIFGLFDVASELGLERHEEDFGQTLAVWGVNDGGYLFWPIVGPRTARDTVGWAVDNYVDPVSNVSPISVRNSMTALRFVDIRASLLPADKVIEEAAFDKYSYIRDAYMQRRRNQVFDGRPPRLDD
jgi:phospholipid-binding lipoprotein MlaA